ncbi:MAG: salicylate hydroxylase [Candidatus Poriferisodalaceae bacterium]|jgi:salicylate hydroxylase
MTSALRIHIIGAGIGGLTLALALRDSGLSCELHEGATELREVGAGVQIGPNASRVLRHLGLGGQLDAVGVRPVSGDLRRWQDGTLLTEQPLGQQLQETFGHPYFHVHRSDLHAMLRDAVVDPIHLGRRCVGVEETPDAVVATFADGTSVTGDIIIGADGVHSAVRTSLHGEQPARFSGAAAWRGLVPADQVADLNLSISSTATLGPGSHFVYYFVSAGRFVNWVGIAPTDTWTTESWTAAGEIDDALADFAGWNPTVIRLIEEMRGQPVYRWAMYDRDPLPVWGEGRVTLLGDACHPMLPYMAQGAAQSIEDAAVLAGVLARIDEPDAALRHYENLRRDRTARVQLAARANEEMFHLPDGPEQQERDLRMAAASGGTHRNAWLFDYDAVTVGRTA